MKMPNGNTLLMGLIGKNISYTLSPIIHNTALEYFKIDAVYLPLSITENHVKDFIAVAWDLGVLGLNVTKPHKETVAKLFPESGFSSVNTLYRGKDRWIPASTDGAGFVRGVERLGQNIGFFKDIVILGSGGATQAILDYFRELWKNSNDLKERKIYIFCRRPEKLKHLHCESFAEIKVKLLDPGNVNECLKSCAPETLFVQATSGPQQGDRMDDYTECLTNFKGVFVDLIYDKPSSLYFAAIAKDIVAQDGEAMLIEQARLAQELWWGKSLPYEVIRETIRNQTKRRDYID